MPPLDTHIFRRINNSYSNQELIMSRGKLPPLLYEEDGSGNNKSKTPVAAGGFPFSTENNQVELKSLDALFLDPTPPFRSYEHNKMLQELADIESQYSELIKPQSSSSHEEAVRSYEAKKISTDAVIRLGGERFIQSTSSVNDISIPPSHPYGSSFSGLSDQQVQDVQLIENLLLSAEKVTQQQFERSIKLLDWCDALSSPSGNPIQRLVYYFSKALRDKVDKETGRTTRRRAGDDVAERVMSPSLTGVLIYEKSPLYQAGHFSGVQALVDGVSGSKKVHVIDLSIKHGVQCTILMQALVSQPNSCPIEHLKITAVGTNSIINQTGDWLKSFAESVNLSFSFNPVIVEDMLDFNKDLLELDPDEALGVYSSFGLWSMIANQDRLEYLMKVIKSCDPRVMVVCEVAANLNSPNFVNRFIEGLFYYGALFDSLEECMGDEDEIIRGITESMYFGTGIKSIVATEGTERGIRHVSMDVWRKFFTRFGMKEIELSMSALYQANLVVEKFYNGRSCTFDQDGNSLIMGWKGTPIQCLSAWEFS